MVSGVGGEGRAVERRGACAFAFLSLPDGSLLALLTPEVGARSAVVLVGSEGEARTVASSLEDFLVRLSQAKTGIQELDDENPGDGREELAAWLEDNEIKHERPAKRKVVDFAAWLKKVNS